MGLNGWRQTASFHALPSIQFHLADAGGAPMESTRPKKLKRGLCR